MSESSSATAVVAALSANLGIAVAKFVAFAFTGSSSMLAEGVHSVVDSANQVLLLIGGRRARRDADASHQFGYGRDRFVYGFLVALIIFSVGGLFALGEGIDKVAHPHHLDSPLIAVAVLGFSLVAESLSLRTALGEGRKVKGQQSWFRFIRTSNVPELPVVLLEDSAALVGLAFALLGIAMSQWTGNPVWDGIGTMAIGLLLVSVAVVLVVETKSLLLGESASPVTQRIIAQELVGNGVERVIHLRTQFLAPEQLMVAAKVAMPAGHSLRSVAAATNAAEARVRAAVPEVTLIYLEPDVDLGPDAERARPLNPAAHESAGER